MILSVPTKDLTHDQKSASTNSAQSLSPKVSKSKTTNTQGNSSTKRDKLASNHIVTTHRQGSRRQTGKKRRTKSTAFWSVKPNNVSIVLRADEPFIEKEEPEPEPEPSTAPSTIKSTTTTTEFISPGSMDTAAEIEDVPQLSGTYMSPEYQRLRNEEILKKISNIRSLVKKAPLSESLKPQYRNDILAAREHLKQSLALAAAAERRLQKMYDSQAIPLGGSGEIEDVETVINVLYNSRSKLSEYFNMKHIPPEMRRKATTVINILKKILCVSRAETQSLIRKLLKNNIKILKTLNVP